ncbi:MAG: alpha/beta hydrolase, partial [Bacteroidales bacterium]|nr:alpha/beta hydrolase [Bacteroidales bacterium]
MKLDTKFSLGSIATFRLDNFPDKPTIVFLHDSFGCIELWKNFPQKLGELTKCNIIVYDRLGYGQSMPFSEVQRTNKYIEKE